MLAVTGSAVHLQTKLGQSLVDNFLGHKGNKESFQALPARQAITQPMWQNTMNTPQRLQTQNVLLPWPTWPLLYLLTVKQ
jgi:hypothetical protein